MALFCRKKFMLIEMMGTVLKEEKTVKDLVNKIVSDIIDRAHKS